MSNLENILQTNESNLDLKLTLNVLKIILDKSSIEAPPDYKLLESRVEKRTGFLQQKVDNMHASPQIFDWSDFRELYSKYDIENFLDQFPDARIERDKIYESTNYTGSHISGLRLNMTVQELSQLIATRHNHTWTSMASNRRAKLSEEKRCLRINNGRVEWLKSLTNLKEFALENFYTKKMTLKMIRELASAHYKNLQDYFDTLSLDQLSQHLISKDAIRYKNEIYISPLKTFERKIGESLQSSFTTAIDLFRMSKDTPKASFDYENEYFNAEVLQFAMDTLINLTETELSAEIRALVTKSRENGEKINFPQLFAGALCYEDQYGPPTRDLKLKYLSNNDENNLSVKINFIDAKNISQVSQSGESSISDEEQELLQVNKLKNVSLSDNETAKQYGSNSSLGIYIPDDIEFSFSDYDQAKTDSTKLLRSNYNEKFDNILQSLNEEHSITSSSDESLIFNSSKVMNYNTNAEFLLRQNSSRSDYRQDPRRSRNELSYDQSRNRQYSYPNNERKRNYMVQNSRDYYRPRDSSPNYRYIRRRSNQSRDYNSDRSSNRSRNRRDKYLSTSQSRSQGEVSRFNSRDRSPPHKRSRQRSYSDRHSSSRSRDSSYNNRKRKRNCNRHDRRRSRQSDDYYSDRSGSRSRN